MSVTNIVKWYLVVIGTATVTLCVQSRDLIIQQFLYQSNIYRSDKTTNTHHQQIREADWRSPIAPETFRPATTGSTTHSSTTTVSRVLHTQGANLEWARNGILYEINNYNISIISAVGRNRTLNSGWDDVILNGWEGWTHVNDTYNCCIYHHDGDVTQVKVSSKNHWYQCNLVPYIATQIVCPNPGRGAGRRRPTGITLVPFTKKCLRRSANMMNIYFPLRQDKESIGLCAKIAYGGISPSRLIEW